MKKNIDTQVEKLEEITDASTVISIGNYSFTPAKLMIAGGILSTFLGALWGTFEIYKDYQSMKEAIQTYVSPDLSGFDKRLAVIEETANKTNDYTRDIKNDLKNDIRRLEKVLEDVERASKQSQRETERDVRELRKEVDEKIKRALDNPLTQ